jgi:hypothetical protein
MGSVQRSGSHSSSASESQLHLSVILTFAWTVVGLGWIRFGGPLTTLRESSLAARTPSG